MTYSIGNAHGRIAMYLDAAEAEALASLYGPGDEAHYELLEAVHVVYPAHFALVEAHSNNPETTDEAPVPGARKAES